MVSNRGHIRDIKSVNQPSAKAAFRSILLGSMMAAMQTPLFAGAPEFAARPVVSNVEADKPDVPATVHCGKMLVIPVVVNDSDGDPLSYSVSTDQPFLHARIRTGHPVMKMRVKSASDGAGAPIDGTMEFALFRADVPDTSDFIAGFAQAPYYENVLFHRVIKGFVLQGGDPAGTGSGASPYTLPHEFRSHLVYSGRGQLAMANSSGGYSQSFPSYGRSFQSTNAFGFPDGTTEYITARTTATNGSQFFITLGQPRHLDFKHTLFGQLLRGFEVMDKVANVPVNASDRPSVSVTMSELSVAPSATDAILLVSATSVGTGTVTVTATDPGGNSVQKTYAIAADEDLVNDPPIVAPIDPQVIRVGEAPAIRAVAEDLESDGISVRMPLQVRRTFTNGTPTTNDTIYAGFNRQNLGVVSRPTPGSWDVTVAVSGVNDPNISANPFDASRFQPIEIGVGDREIEATPVTLEARAGTGTGTVTLAKFRYGGAAASPSDLIATVNWGDGSTLQGSSGANPPIIVAPSATAPGMWEVRGSHTYVRAGVYPLHVTIDGPLGATRTAKGSAVVAAELAPFLAIGQSHSVRGAVFTGKPIALISDSTPGVSPADFAVTIDWGDGMRSGNGVTVRQLGTGRFGVFATRRYSDAENYSVMVHVTRAGFSTSAWSRLEMKGFSSARYRPPFPKANIAGQWVPSLLVGGRQVGGLPEKTIVGNQTSVRGFFFISNNGTKSAVSPKLRFYLSGDNKLITSGNGADTLLSMGPASRGTTQIPVKSLTPGSGGTIPIQTANGMNLTLQLPPGETGAGKFLIAHIDYQDPITDHMAVPKSVVFGPLPGINVTLPSNTSQLFVREGAAGSVGTTSTFTVVLDTLPTADVRIPLEVLNAAGTLDESQLSLSHTELVFTPQNGKVPQTVTVTAKDDAIRESDALALVRLRPASSADSRFAGMDADDVRVSIADNDQTGPRGILASRSSISLTEGGSVTFTVRPTSAPTQTATMAVEIVDANGNAVTGQATVNRTSISFTTGNGTTEQTITVTAVNDSVAEATANYTIRLKPLVSTDTNYSGVDPVDIPVTILDND